MKPLISLVIPVYNVRSYLKKCVECLLHQSYENIEILLIDDGSTDGSERLCDEFALRDGRVRVFHKPNGGLSDARNYGVARAHGKYLSFVDSDDYVDDDYVEYLYSLLDGTDVKMSVCQHKTVQTGGKIRDHARACSQEVVTDKTFIERMLYRDVIDTSAWAKLYACCLFEGVAFPKGKLYEDIATVYKLALASKRVAVGYKSKYYYVIREQSIVNCPYNRKKTELLEMTDRMAKDVVSVFPDLAPAVRCRRVYARISTLNQMIGARGVEEAQREITDFIKSNTVVLHDKKVGAIDKIAVRLICKSITAYKVVWRIYKKLFKD